MKLPDLDKERLVMYRLVNGWLAIGLVSTTVWLVVQVINFIKGLF
jgi:hypothetical protein